MELRLRVKERVGLKGKKRMINVGDKLYDRDKRRLNRELTVSKILLSGIIAKSNGRNVSISLSRLGSYSTEPIEVPKIKHCKISGCMGTPKKGESC